MHTSALPLSVSLARFSHAIAVCAAISLASSSRAAELNWDPGHGSTNIGVGGAGSVIPVVPFTSPAPNYFASGISLGKSGAGSLILSAPDNTLYTISAGASAAATSELVIDFGSTVTASIGIAGGTGTHGDDAVILNGGTLQLTPVIGNGALSGHASGLVGQYYNQGVALHSNLTTNVDFTRPDAIRIDDDLRLPSLNVVGNRGSTEGVPSNIGRIVGSSVEDFAAQWTGLINITTGGEYTFVSSSDDASVVIIDGVKVVSNENGHGFPGPGHFGTPVNLTPGLHSITVRLTQGTGGAGVVLAYQGPDQPIPVANPFPTSNYDVATLVPASVLSHANLAGTITNEISIPDAATGGIDAAGLDIVSTGTLTLGTFSTLRLGSTTGHTLTQTGDVVMGGNVTISTQLTDMSTAANVLISGAISQSSSAFEFGITKIGRGTLTLTGANTFTGPIDIFEGHVAGTTSSIKNDISLAPGTSIIFDQSTNGTFSKAISSFGGGLVVKTGTGTVDFTQNIMGGMIVNGGTAIVGNGLTGDATVNTGGVLQIGNTVNGNAIVNGGELAVIPPVGTAFTVGSLNLNGGKVSLTLPGAVPGYPLVDSLAQLSIGKSTLVNLGGSVSSAGVYKLIDYTGGSVSQAEFHRLVLGSVPSGNFYGILVNNTAGTSIDYAVEAFGATNTWLGQTNGVWDTATASNWTSGAFAGGQQVTFGDSATNKTISGTAVSSQRITFDNTAGNDYTISNEITGTLAGGIVKTGNGNATLSGRVSSAGTVSVSGGTLRLTNTSVSTPNQISGRWSIDAGGTVEAAFGGTRTGTTDPSGSNALGSAVVDLNGGTLLLAGKDYDGGAGGLTTHVYSQQVQRNARAEFRNLSSLNALFNTSTPDALAAPNAGLTDAITTVDFANAYGTNPPFASLGFSTADNIMATWRGQFIAPEAGTYTFTGRSDDGMVVFIDGQLVLDRNNFQGASNTTSTIDLTAGRHDIYVGYYEGASSAGVQLFKDAAGTVVYGPESFAAAQPLTTLGNDVRWNASSTIAADNTHGVILGKLSANTPGTTLTSGRVRVTGQPSADGIVRFTDTDFNAPGTYTINALADIALGAIQDGENTITLVKTGPGNLVLDSDGSAVDTNGTTISIQEGRLVASRSGAGNPLGNATLQLDGEGTIIQFNRTEANTGTSSFVNPIKVNANARIETARHGGAAADILLGNVGTGITIASGKTLELHATNGGNVLMDGPITGDATVRISAGNDPGQSQGFVLLRAPNTFSGALIVENGGNLRIDHAQALGTQEYISVDTNARLEFYAANAFSESTPRILSKPGSFLRINSNSNPSVTIGSGTLEVGPGRILEMQTANPYTGGGTIAKAINSYYSINSTFVPFQAATTQVGLRASDVRPLDVFRISTTVTGAGAGVLNAGWGAMPAGSIVQIIGGDRNISNGAIQEINGQIITSDGTGRTITDAAGLHIAEKGAVFTSSGGTLTFLENIQTDANSGRITIGAHIPLDNRFATGIVAFANSSGGTDFTGTMASADKAIEVIAGAAIESRVTLTGDSGLGSASAPTIGVTLARGSLRAYQPTANLSTAGTYSITAGKVFVTGAGTIQANRNTTNAGVIAEVRLGSEIERSQGATIGLHSQNNILGGGERFRFTNHADAPDRLSVGGATVNMVAPYIVNVSNNLGSFVDYDPAQDSVTGPGFVNVTYQDAAAETDFGSGKIINTTGNISLTADQTAAAVRLQGNLSGNFTLTSETGGFIVTSGGNTGHTISAKLAAAPGKEFVVYSGGVTGGIHNLSGTITSDSGFVKFGPRTLSLGADNSTTLFGDIYINEASLVISADNRLGDAANKVVLNGGNLRPSGSFAIPREIIVNAGGGQLTNDGNRNVEFSGVISGAGGLTINAVNGNNGVNRLTSPEPNTFEGGLIITNGVLEFSRNDQLGALPDVSDYDRGHIVISDSNTNATLRLAAGAGEVSTGARQFTLLGAGARIDVPGLGDVLTIANDIRGSGGLNKFGFGVLALTNPEGNGYIGNTVVNEGTLLVNSAQFSPTGAGSVTVNPGATLAGNAVIEGSITVASGGTLAPGASLGAGVSGVLQTQNGLTLEQDAVLEWSLSNRSTANPGVDFDRVIVDNGALNVFAGAEIRVNFGLGVAPSSDAFWSQDHIWNDVIQVISLGTIASAGAFEIDNSAWAEFGSFSAVADENGYDIVWTTAVPEPTSAITLLAGIGGLLGIKRFRRKA